MQVENLNWQLAQTDNQLQQAMEAKNAQVSYSRGFDFFNALYIFCNSLCIIYIYSYFDISDTYKTHSSSDSLVHARVEIV